MAKIEIDTKRCKGCGFCVHFCPKGIIEMSSNFNPQGYHTAVFNSEKDCTGCAICALVCPEVAIKVYK
ncbi:4Fe-4S binding protein [Candidatus Aerophobetes bacterium]|nr:4Fe-4S binding protein [Candidatus Aerophobetes bacterium]